MACSCTDQTLRVAKIFFRTKICRIMSGSRTVQALVVAKNMSFLFVVFSYIFCTTVLELRLRREAFKTISHPSTKNDADIYWGITIHHF